ncbi:MAG: hypothetical protein HUU37_02095 [Bdellovibrionales bacterium]|nr:hypothetical protein [Bdellovibrionales bacterium]
MGFAVVFLLLSLGLAPAAMGQTAPPPFRICYFSLNNEKEFQETKKFVDRLNRSSPRKIEVTEYQDSTGDAKPEESFQRLVESGVECDGLVISGHHTGAWGGKRAKGGSLSLDFMETLACDPKHKAWFERVHALWLQGCRTLGIGEIRADERDSDAVSADFHTQRVGDVREEDHLQQGFSDLNMEFSATLDQDNPLSSRYLRLFPRSTVFGWTRTAPGEKSHSERSLLYHMAHIARRISKEDKFPENPESFSPKAAEAYFLALRLAIDDLHGRRGDCEDLLVGSWLDHGTPGKSKGYGFNNPDLNAHRALQRNSNPQLERARRLDCLFRKGRSKEELHEALSEALRDRRSIGLTFNSIFEALQRLKREGQAELLKEVQEKLRGSAVLQAFLSEKLASRQLGVLRKIDYYAFSREMWDRSDARAEDQIRAAAMSQLLVPLRNANDYDRRDYKQTLMESLSKHGLVTKEFLGALVDSPKADYDALGLVAQFIGASKHPIEGASEILRKIVDSPKAGNYAHSHAAWAIGESKHPIEGAAEMLRKIVDSPLADGFVLEDTAQAIASSKFPIEGAAEILRKIVNSPKADAIVLSDVCLAIGNSKSPIEGAAEILKKTMDSPKADVIVFSNAARAIGSSKFPIEGASEILRKIVDSPKADEAMFSNAARAIGSSKFPIEGASAMLRRIVDSPKADGYVLERAAMAIGESEHPIEEATEILRKIVDSPKAGSKELISVAWIIGASKHPIEGAAEMLRKIVDSPKAGSKELISVAWIIGGSKSPIEGESEILKKIVDSPKMDNESLADLADQIRSFRRPLPEADAILQRIEERRRGR